MTVTGRDTAPLSPDTVIAAVDPTLTLATAKEPAHVFASSGGAVIGLELVARHPEQVRTLLPHDPPAPALLSDPARERAGMADIVQTYRAAGIGPAMQKFMVQTGIRSGPPPPPAGEPTPEMREAKAQFRTEEP